MTVFAGGGSILFGSIITPWSGNKSLSPCEQHGPHGSRYPCRDSVQIGVVDATPWSRAAVVAAQAQFASAPTTCIASVGCLGYGAMVLEGYYGISGDQQAFGAIQRAPDVGMSMIDTADAYGNGHNEVLVGRAIAGMRQQAFVATKFGIVFDESETGTELPTGGGFSLKINGRPSYVRRALNCSLKRLGVDVIDLWYAHYADPATPIEGTVGAMAEAVHAGNVRYLGLSNVSAEQVRRAHRVHPITAVQFEYSLCRREPRLEHRPLQALHDGRQGT